MTDVTVVQAEEPATEVMPPASKKRILIIYDDETGRIPDPLEENLQLMYRYLGDQVSRHYFRYRTLAGPKPYTGNDQYLKNIYDKEKEEYEKQVKDYKNARANMRWFLQQDQLLIILIVSNSVMGYLLEDMQQDAELSSLLVNPTYRIVYVLKRPTVGFTNYGEPLCACEGVDLEVACQRVATTIEAIAREHFFGNLILPQENPLTLLTSPTSIHVSVPSKSDHAAQMLAGVLSPLQKMFEQTNTRIVEAQQLALAERSEREARQESEADLRQQLEQVRHQLTTLQTWQNASMGAKLRHFFSIPSPK